MAPSPTWMWRSAGSPTLFPAGNTTAATHSLFFGPVLGPLFGWAIWRLEMWRTRRCAPERLRPWIWLAVLVLVTHPVIDLFTSYGTQLLAPFSTHRFAIDALPGQKAQTREKAR